MLKRLLRMVARALDFGVGNDIRMLRVIAAGHASGLVQTADFEIRSFQGSVSGIIGVSSQEAGLEEVVYQSICSRFWNRLCSGLLQYPLRAVMVLLLGGQVQRLGNGGRVCVLR